jgi:putative DNA primase/helicase
VWFDEFLQRILTGNPPREWTESDDVHLTLRFQREKRIPQMALDTVRNAVTEIAFRRKRNCIKDWLESLVWDKTARIDNFFEDYYGTPRTDYTMAASKNSLIAMVARVYKPGCQVDNMPVMEGPQGILKSSSLRALAGEYHAEQHENVTQKDFLQNLQGKWLIEISEMDSFSKSETSKVKAVITTVSDHFRPSYGRRSVDHPRQCVFVGTTNRDDWNRDETGARRFWPIQCGVIDIDGIRKNRNQLFAEAVHRFKKGESWWEMPADETQKQQHSRYVAPAWVELIEKYIHHERVRDDNHDGFRWIPRAEPLTELSIAEVLEHALDVPRAQWSKANEMRVAESLRFLEWIKKDVKRDGKTVKRWVSVAT